jgi:hypothetical protein
MKHFCSIHCFNYTGDNCPYCEADKINSYVKRYNKDIHSMITKPIKPKIQPEKTTDDSNELVTDEMLNALVAKFNH